MFAWLLALMASLQLIVMSAAAPASTGTTAPTAVPSSAVATRTAPAPSASPAGTTGTTTPQIAVLDVNRNGSRIDAALTGGDLSRAWRIDVARAGSASGRRLELSVETSDVAYLGGVTISGGAGATVTYGLTARFSYCDRELGLCVASSGISVPAADSRLALTVTTTANGSYTVHAAVREAHDAPFMFGPWIEAAPITV